jgi:hypothetical protein
VQNYIGTGWPVADGPAVELACTFYERALRRECLAEALAAGRKAILAQGPTWGAYHHYGDPNAKLVS